MVARCSERLISLLESYGVDHVFGIPGVHTVELYRALAASDIRHVTPRHEQGAGFMADGFARVSGRPGVCFIITGPGVTNIATAMAQAYSDSVPMLVISSVNATGRLGLGSGQLHELPYQRNLTAQYTEFSHTLLDPAELPEVLARAFAVFRSRRPAPVHIEIPVDVMVAETPEFAGEWPVVSRPGADRAGIARAAELLLGSTRPVILIGGGSLDAAPQVRRLVEVLDAPVINTVAAKGVIPASHPLCLDATMAFAPVRRLIGEADVVLAVGTEFSETDRYGDERPLEIPGKLIRIDIDPEQVVRNHRPALSLVSDAAMALEALCEQLSAAGRRNGTDAGEGAQRSARVREEIRKYRRFEALIAALRKALPAGATVAADSTQPVYSANSFFPMERPRRWITSVTGYGTLGYALPAAIGARLAAPETPTICVTGDGGLMFCLGELAAAVELALPIPILVWNNRGYGEIRDYMIERQIPPLGVNLHTPDFTALAAGFGCAATRLHSLADLVPAMERAFEARGPTLIEIPAEIDV